MKVKKIPHRRKFANEWDEIAYLHHKLLFWLYERETAARARPYAKRLAALLLKADPNDQAILAQECWSLIYETEGELHKAIEHREREIALIRRLYEISHNHPSEEWVLRGYGYDDLGDRLDLLAILYHDSGNLDKGIAVLQESKRLCEKHGLEFDGADILQDYLEEKASKSDRSD